MQDWIKIQTFDKIHQAELRKDILEENDIESVIINEKDSLFLLGEIELYVKNKDKSKANALIDEFFGLTKINSFFLYKPIKLFYDILVNEGINVVLMEKKDKDFLLDNFELFIENDKIEDVVPYLTGEKLTGWKKVESCLHTRQVRFRVEILDKNNIDAIVIKKKDSNLHVEEINIYVQDESFEKAKTTLTILQDWVIVKTYDKLHRAEIREDLLGKNNIRAIIKKKTTNEYDLLVKTDLLNKSLDVIKNKKEWIKIASTNSNYKAQIVREKLELEKIDAIVINQKDSMFLLGEYYLYVDEIMVDKAKKILELN